MDTTGGVSLSAQLISNAKGQERIKNLRNHDDIKIREKALKVFDKCGFNHMERMLRFPAWELGWKNDHPF
ncbi:hypothetical protein V6N11_061026 [Hibiscus sabdariffa]|uniref:Uncharacterized protein n=1 Tax=Hibiscus sabdariffa TaxID=183260 RepID=A0ABR2QS26_9ROSI